MRRLLPALLCLGLVACGGSGADPTPQLPLVEYSVSGTATSVGITYANESEGTSQLIVASPWSLSFRCLKADQFLYLSAQNQNDSGSVTVRIRKDGVLFKESTSSGAFVIASTSGGC